MTAGRQCCCSMQLVSLTSITFCWYALKTLNFCFAVIQYWPGQLTGLLKAMTSCVQQLGCQTVLTQAVAHFHFHVDIYQRFAFLHGLHFSVVSAALLSLLSLFVLSFCFLCLVHFCAG